jgi:hypothetical protein
VLARIAFITIYFYSAIGYAISIIILSMKNKIILFIQGCIILVLLVQVSCKEPITGPQVGTGPIPPAFFLNQNYPNPFIDTTTITYGIPSTGGSNSSVTIIVYDLFRKEMRTLVNNYSHPPGTFQTKWDGLDSRGITVPSGLYIIELRGYTPQATIFYITAIKE